MFVGFMSQPCWGESYQIYSCSFPQGSNNSPSLDTAHLPRQGRREEKEMPTLSVVSSVLPEE